MLLRTEALSSQAAGGLNLHEKTWRPVKKRGGPPGGPLKTTILHGRRAGVLVAARLAETAD